MKKITLLCFALFALCWQANAQFSEDFEAGVPGLFTEMQDASAVAWGSCGGSLGLQTCAITGTASATFYDTSYSATVTSLTTPTMDLSAASGFRLKFNHSQEAWFTDQNTLEVLISTDGGTTFTSMVNYTTSIVAFVEEIIDLTPYTPTATTQIRFEGTSVYGRSIVLDDVVVEPLPACIPTVVDSSTVVDDCGNSQFSVDVVVSTVGDGTNITDGLGGTFPVVAGTVTAGPYTIGDTITLTVEHTDGACDFSEDFETGCTLPGEVCENAIVVGSLPYNTTDTTANFGDDYTGSPGASGCGSTSTYLNGDDVVYAYTATADTSINVSLTGIGDTYVGVFAYENCADIGTACVAGAINSFSTADLEFDLAVVNGSTYYVVISTWATPQSSTYTLDITENFCTAATVTIPAAAIDNANCPATVDVSISIDDLGDATSLTITAEDDMGNPAGTGGTVTATGIFTITNIPVPQTSWTIKIAHSSDITCDLYIGPFFIECPPANDDLANAMPIVCGDVVTGDNSYATLDEDTAPDPTGGADTDSPNVWYSWTGTGDDVTLSTIAAGFTLDTDIIVFTGTSGALTAIVGGYDEGGAPLYQSEATFTSVLGTDYLIAVDGYGSASLGTFQLTMTCVSPPPVNDECSGAIAVALGADTAFDNTGATDSGVATCYSGAVSDLWYSFDAPMSGDVTITVGAGTQFSLWSGACGTLAQVGTCDQVAHTGLASGTYYLSVTDDGGASTLRVDDTATLSTTDFDSSVGFTYYPNPVNNTLTLSAQKEISNVAVFNMLGQEVIRTAPNAVSNDVDMSNLQSGAYFVQVTIGQAVETVRVIKN
ncbi:T9SS type A sorting domain-containing protein [Lacinutrix sp.]|uniref:T9SS type A sorting domain-containing protein n=1 Tax=Lacinutrix sp. TaxID=1937692 RepID=UPI00261E2FD3|nr:T9SS type A sorting domain-containing protein [Lacinutrix sp.]MDG1715169.1 T9SS type A sorting domain-containing protein [Lacinutrix sp.]